MSDDEQMTTPNRRQFRQENNLPRFVYVIQRGDHTESEGARSSSGGGGRLVLPWENGGQVPASWATPADADAPIVIDDAEVQGLVLPDGDWTVVPYDENAPELHPVTGEPIEPDVPLDDALPDIPAPFKRIRDAINKMFERSTSEDDPAPVFLNAEEAKREAARKGSGEWWDETLDGHEVSVAPDPAVATGVELEADAEAELAPQPDKRELKAQKKAEAQERREQAREEKARKAAAKKKAKEDSLSEEKRQAIAAKEAKALERKRLREAQDEQKIAQDEVKGRARREKKSQAEYDRKQKRRAAIRRNGGKEGFWQGTNKPKPIEIANSIRSLAIILETSPAEVDAVKMMAEEFAGNRIGDAFDRIYDRLVKDNMTLVDAFEPEELFPIVVHNMLRVGAKTAKPGPALRTSVDIMDSGNDNSRKMRNAVREPAVLAVMSMAILFVTAWFVMPVFIEMYDAMELEVGAITSFVLVFANISVWVLGLIAAASAATAVWWFASGRSSLRVRIALDRFKLFAPLIGKGEQTGAVFQMFNILDSYLSVGSTEREALLNTAVAMENRAITRHLRATANGLTRGEKTFAQFLDDDMFPRMARSILATGQRSGQTVQVIKNLRDIYQKEAAVEGEQSVAKVVALVSAISSILFTVTATIVSIPPLEIFGATLGYKG